ncbi:MAG: ORF6N domain-containing protein [Candidatus Peregrinibacteria bacterium]|nr:ORF6N domain-containing protein [Candidatus Peregrinibacteria bacterium]
MKELMNGEIIDQTIYLVRGLRVLLDEDLAKIYGVETKVMNQAIKRNRKRFPEDFMFQLTVDEYSNLRSQIVTSSYGGRRYMPFVFTEHGAIMLASVLKSKRAIQMSIEVVRAFVRLRNILTSQKDIFKQISEIRSFVLKQSNKTDQELKKVWKIIEELANTDPDDQKTKIGFKLDN